MTERKPRKKAATGKAVEKQPRYPERPLPRTDVTYKIAFLDACGVTPLRAIAEQTGCTEQHVKNLRTHPEYKRLVAEYLDSAEFEPSLELRLFVRRSLDAAAQALDAAVDQLGETLVDDQGQDTGIPQPVIRQGAIKEILANVGRLAAANARATEPGAVAPGAVVNITFPASGEPEVIVDG